MLRLNRLRNVRCGASVVVRHGRPIHNLFIPIQRVDGIMSRGGRQQTLEMSAVAAVLRDIVSSMETGEHVGRIVCIQIKNWRDGDDRLSCECLLKRQGDVECHIFTLAISNPDGVPSAHGVQTAAMLVARYLQTDASERTVFVIGCLKGLNRTGFLVCAILHTLFGIPVGDALSKFRCAHYPGIVKQAFIDTLLTRYGGGEPRHPLDAMPANFSYYNIVHKSLLPEGITADEERLVSFSERGFEPMVDVMVGRPDRLKDPGGSTVREGRKGANRWAVCRSAAADVCALMESAYLLHAGSDQRASDGIRREFLDGFVKLVPCTAARMDALGEDGRGKVAVSVKADGVHGTLFIMPYGTYLATRGHHQHLRLLPVVARSLVMEPVCYALECEVITSGQEISVYCFDMIYSTEWSGSPPPFMMRHDELARLMESLSNNMKMEHACGASVQVMHKPFLFVGRDTAVLRKVLNLDRNAFQGAFGEELTKPGRYDGFVISIADKGVAIPEERYRHMKLKQHHTIDLFVEEVPDGVRLSYARDRATLVEMCGPAGGAFPMGDGKMAPVAPPPDACKSCAGRHAEFKVAMSGGTVTLEMERERPDINRPNAENTVRSCILSTRDPFKPKDLLEKLESVMEGNTRKRRRTACSGDR